MLLEDVFKYQYAAESYVNVRQPFWFNTHTHDMIWHSSSIEHTQAVKKHPHAYGHEQQDISGLSSFGITKLMMNAGWIRGILSQEAGSELCIECLDNQIAGARYLAKFMHREHAVEKVFIDAFDHTHQRKLDSGKHWELEGHDLDKFIKTNKLPHD